jgi:hypothetical protein
LYRKELSSPAYTIDRIYKSMQGPMSRIEFSMETAGEPELLWVVAYSARNTNADGSEPLPDEFMCHSNVGLVGDDHRSRLPSQLRVTANRLFALDQGTTAIQFPEGFGIPILSDQLLVFNPQVLNHNIANQTFQVRQRVAIDFVRDRDLERPLAPLVQHGVFGMALLSGPDGHFGIPQGEGDADQHGPGCSLAEDAKKVRRQGHGHLDGHGREFSGFWVVPQGRHVYHTRVTPQLRLPYDTTVHFASAHLHPFAESLELRDLTAGTTVVALKARQAERGIGLERVGTFSSSEGVRIHRDHEYDLVSTYDNTSGAPQDAMATMFLYMHATDLAPRGVAGGSDL